MKILWISALLVLFGAGIFLLGYVTGRMSVISENTKRIEEKWKWEKEQGEEGKR